MASGVLTLAMIAACASPAAPPVGPAGSGKPRVRASGTPGGQSVKPATIKPPVILASVSPLEPGGGLISDKGASIVGKVKGPAGIVANNGGGIIANNGGGVVSNNGGGVVSNNGGNVVSNNGGSYRLTAVEEVPGVGLEVELQRADGTPLRDAAGQRITDVTKADGSYRLPFAGGDRHALVAVKLPADRGKLLAFVARGAIAKPTQVDVDLTSTLTMGYILEKYVKDQADPVAVLERLPPALEAETRTIVATAVAKETTAPLTLTASEVLATVERIRDADPAVDAQLEVVRTALLAGLSNLGAGEPADTIETDAAGVVVAPGGEIVFAGSQSRRVWKKDQAGRLTPIAGSGLNPIVTMPTATDPAPGDGGSALESYVSPVAIAYTTAGDLLIADKDFKRIRAVSPAGVITTRAAHADWAELRDLLVEPDGGLVVATHSGIWRVPPGGQPALVAGDVRAFDSLNWIKLKPAGDGGRPADARFVNIQDLARDPRNGDLLVHDACGQVRRLGADVVARVAGSDTAALSAAAATGDGGPAASAVLGRLGGVAVRPDGAVVIADAASHRLREVVNGTINAVAGTGLPTHAGDGGPAQAAGIVEPRSPFLAADGTLYFCDQGFVRRFSNGTVGTIIGGTRGFDVPRPSREVQLNAPAGLTYDAATHALWVTDSRHVWRWTLADDRMVSVFGRGPAGADFSEGQAASATNLYLPRAVRLEGPDTWTMFASDPNTLAGRVLRVAGGALTTLAGGVFAAGQLDKDGPAIGATIVAADIDVIPLGGWYYYNVLSLGRIRRFQPGGNVEGWGGYGTGLDDGTPAKDFDFKYTYAMAPGPDGQLYVADAGWIYRIDPVTAAVTWVAGAAYGTGGDGGPAKEAKLTFIGGFAWDAAGHMYFSEPDQACVRRLRKDTGIIERVVGERTSLFAGKTIDTGLAGPAGLAFDKNGDLYIADFRHGQIKVVPKSQLPP